MNKQIIQSLKEFRIAPTNKIWNLLSRNCRQTWIWVYWVLEHFTLCTGMSLAVCIFISIAKLLKSAKIPLTVRFSGRLPLYLPDKINGPSDERSGIWEGYTYHKHYRQCHKEEAQAQGKLEKNSTYSSMCNIKWMVCTT